MISWLMLFKEIITVYSKNCTEHLNTITALRTVKVLMSSCHLFLTDISNVILINFMYDLQEQINVSLASALKL
jgi:hypothetical protein